MDVLVLLLIMACSAVLGAMAALEYAKEHRPEREAELVADLEALRSAQALSIEAWQARQAMAEVVREVGHSRNGRRG
jgi:hypothetical protein